MNKQRKVLITTTYNELGKIIDTKAEEVTQPNSRPTCDQLATVTISRQAVINAIANTCFWLSSDNWEELIKCINSIPPVNPQEPKIGWIPVSKRLPKEKDDSVIVTMPDKKVRTARYSEFSDTWYVGDMMGVGGPDPLAWVLLTPYEPQEK